MQSIYDIRRGNLAALLRVRFQGQQVQFAELMGYEPSMVSRLLSKNAKTRQNIGSKLARKIEAKMGLVENWLDGHGAASGQNVTAAPDFRQVVPLISWAQSLQWREAMQLAKDVNNNFQWIATTAAIGPNAYALRVSGDSMENPNGSPSFPDGTIIIVDPDRPAEPGRFVIAKTGEECTFKQLVRDAGKSFLKPLNPRYPLIELSDLIVTCGTVVQAIYDLI
jgi:SOS-response transcriptional repressor LexA